MFFDKEDEGIDANRCVAKGSDVRVMTCAFANKAQETRCSLRLNRATKPRDRSYFTTSCSRPRSTRTTRVRTLSRHFSSSRERHVSRVESSRVRALIARSPS